MIVKGNIRGLEELLEKERTIGENTQGLLTSRLMNVGNRVASSTYALYQPYSTTGAQGVKSKVFTSGLWVVQTLKKSRNPQRQRPNFGPLMMRKAFLPALRSNESYAISEAESAVEVARKLWEA